MQQPQLPELAPQWVPVVSSTGMPLMPCHPARARRLIKAGKAVPKFHKDLFYIQLTHRATGDVQPITLGIDPGSKMEGYTLKSQGRTFLNIQSHARNGLAVKKTMENRSNARRVRRYRKTPYRACRPNRAKSKNWIPPSTLSRWQLKLNIILWLRKLYPVTAIVIEDVKAETSKNCTFSPVQAGKNWLYNRLEALGLPLHKVLGIQTHHWRNKLGLPKTKMKLSTVFSAHCVDSWVLASSYFPNHLEVRPDMTSLKVLTPLQPCRRQLHVFKPVKGGVRKRQGGTMSLGFKKGTLVYSPKLGFTILGGNLNGKYSLHGKLTCNRLTQTANPKTLRIFSYSPWVLNNPRLANKLIFNHKADARKQRRILYKHGFTVTQGVAHAA